VSAADAVAAAFAAWFLATAVKALPGGSRYVGFLGPLGALLPSWNFFAPTPGVHDYALLYRDRSRPRRSALWNPEKYARKALVDATVELCRVAERRGAEAAVLSVPYLMLLQHVSARPRDPGTVERQFMLAILSKEGRPLETAFLSGFHPLEAA
jgi:hypothetical protein